jgi:hypothetical protein
MVSNNNGGSKQHHKIDSKDNTVQSSPYVFNGTVPSNPLISILEDKLRPYILHFLDSVRSVVFYSVKYLCIPYSGGYY